MPESKSQEIAEYTDEELRNLETLVRARNYFENTGQTIPMIVQDELERRIDEVTFYDSIDTRIKQLESQNYSFLEPDIVTLYQSINFLEKKYGPHCFGFKKRLDDFSDRRNNSVDKASMDSSQSVRSLLD